MRIKKFIASNMQEGKTKIMHELGEDAVILSSRTIKKPGDSRTEIIEIVAAIDDAPLKSLNKRLSAPELEKRSALSVAARQARIDGEDKYLQITSKIYEDIGSMKNILGEIADNVKYKFSGSMGEVYGEIYKALRRADFSDEFALGITGKLSSHGSEDFAQILIKARKLATEHLKILPPLKKDKKMFKAAFIGPTGSGKTASLVKLAIVSKLVLESNVLIISADTHKVGGAEQLQTFAAISGIQFFTAYSPEELKDIFNEEKARDFIFVDTTGRNPNNKGHLDEIGEFLAAVEFDYRYLTLSATSSLSTCENVFESFSTLNPNALILTKIDEAETLGAILTTLKNHLVPIAYITTGQKIPEDIEPAGREKLGKIILPDSLEVEYSQKITR